MQSLSFGPRTEKYSVGDIADFAVSRHLADEAFANALNITFLCWRGETRLAKYRMAKYRNLQPCPGSGN